MTHMKCKNFEFLNIEFMELFPEPDSERFEIFSCFLSLFLLPYQKSCKVLRFIFPIYAKPRTKLIVVLGLLLCLL